VERVVHLPVLGQPVGGRRRDRPPNVLVCPKPTSSSRMTSTLGAFRRLERRRVTRCRSLSVSPTLPLKLRSGSELDPAAPGGSDFSWGEGRSQLAEAVSQPSRAPAASSARGSQKVVSRSTLGSLLRSVPRLAVCKIGGRAGAIGDAFFRLARTPARSSWPAPAFHEFRTARRR